MPVTGGKIVDTKLSRSKSKQYYRSMLKNINIIQKTILSSLSCSRKTNLSPRTCRKLERKTEHKYQPCDSKVNLGRQGKAKTKAMHNQADDANMNNSSFLGTRQPIREEDVFRTPKGKNKKSSIFDSPYDEFHSPFDQCVFNMVETVRKVNLLSCTSLSLQPAQISSQTRRNIWQKSDQSRMKVNQRGNQTMGLKSGRQNKQNVGSWAGKWRQQQQKPLEFEGNLSELEYQFEECLMEKKGVNPERQLELRLKMTELSYRISKIKEKQLKLAGQE